MDEKRKGEIALLFLKHKLRRDGIRLGQNTKREIGNTAKDLGISFDEAIKFAEELTRELVDEVFVLKGSGFRDGVSDSDDVEEIGRRYENISLDKVPPEHRSAVRRYRS